MTLEEAAKLVGTGRGAEALKTVQKCLNADPANAKAIFILGEIAMDDECYGHAVTLFRRCTELQPREWECWNNLGRALEETYRWDDAERAFQESLRQFPRNSYALGNLGMIALNKGQPQRAIEYSSKALAIDATNPGFTFTRGLAHLMLREWKPGWIDYEAQLGKSKERKERKYSDPVEPRWDGAKGQKVVSYGEQGIGDQINFASCLPDLIRDCGHVVLDIDKRLRGLYQRSFPGAIVYGDLYNDSPDWIGDYKFDAGVALGGLPRFYRNSDSAFPGTPYLIADPERRIQWRALFDTLPGRKIGLAWNGGVFRTGAHRRSLTPEQLMPLFEATSGDTWVCLEYKEPDLSGFGFIKDWPRGSRSHDYDDTAAMVAELDLVVSVQTSIVHLSGALGVKCFCLVPDRPRFIYLLEGTKMPWYNSVTIFRQKFGKWPIQEVAEAVKCLP